MLGRLITDFYCSDAGLVNKIIAKVFHLSHRRSPFLSSSYVSSDYAVFILNCLLRMKFMTNPLLKSIDKLLSLHALRCLKSSELNLLLYSGYALDAFRYSAAFMGKSALRYLFVYHPSGDFVRPIYDHDLSLFPVMHKSYCEEIRRIKSLESATINEEVSLSNGIITASSFTAASVSKHISQSCKSAVVPYGPGRFSAFHLKPDSGYNINKPRLLFVGQGTQRKGIHHLLHLWISKYYHCCSLSLVLNNVDPHIASLLRNLPGSVQIHSNLSSADLQSVYDGSDIFVLPSLCEGFGFVYLEALARGCLLVGTSNTCLPDLDLPPSVCQIASPSDLHSLEASIDALIIRLKESNLSRLWVSSLSAQYSWSAFRKGIQEFCHNS